MTPGEGMADQPPTGPMIVWFPQAQGEDDLTDAQRAVAQTAEQVHYGSDAPDFTPPEL